MKMELLNYTISVLEYGSCFLFLNSLLKKRFLSCLPIILVTLTGAAIIYCCMGFNMTVKAIIGLAIIFGGSSILFSDKHIIKFSYSLLLLFFISIIDVLFGSIFAIFLDKEFAEVFYSDFTYRMASCLMIKAIDIALLILIQRAFRSINYDLNPKYWGVLGIVFFIFLLATVASLNFYSRITQNKEVIVFFLIISLSLFFISLIVVYFFSEICAGFQRDKKMYMLESSNKVLENALAVQNSNSENLKKIRHDITKHTSNAVALIESGQFTTAASLLKNVSETVERIFPRHNIKTGNAIVDAIVSTKAAVCESKNIIFSYHIESLKDIHIDAVDLSSLLSNLLDNAVEAAQKTPNGYIELEIFKYKAYYSFCLKNSFLGEQSIIHKETRLISTKASGEMHGYGTLIIEEIANKYNGNSTWSIENGDFKTNILLKI